MIDRYLFYQNYRKLFEDRIVQSQVESYEAIFDVFEEYVGEQVNPPAPYSHWEVLESHLSYILATCYHEVGPSMRPLREGPASLVTKGILVDDKTARGHVAWMHRKGIISRNYALPDPEMGHSYYGRGKVQLTHKDNYRRFGEFMGRGDRYVWNPDKLLEEPDASECLVYGMAKGLFTGAGLFKYLNAEGEDYYRARRIVNGLDRANIIKGYAEKYEICIVESGGVE